MGSGIKYEYEHTVYVTNVHVTDGVELTVPTVLQSHSQTLYLWGLGSRNQTALVLMPLRSILVLSG